MIDLKQIVELVTLLVEAISADFTGVVDQLDVEELSLSFSVRIGSNRRLVGNSSLNSPSRNTYIDITICYLGIFRLMCFLLVLVRIETRNTIDLEIVKHLSELITRREWFVSCRAALCFIISIIIETLRLWRRWLIGLSVFVLNRFTLILRCLGFGLSCGRRSVAVARSSSWHIAEDIEVHQNDNDSFLVRLYYEL